MTRVPAVRQRDLPDAEIARLLATRFEDVIESDDDNWRNRTRNLQTPLREAVRRLRVVEVKE